MDNCASGARVEKTGCLQVSFLNSAAMWSGLSKLVLIWVSTSMFSTTNFCAHEITFTANAKLEEKITKGAVRRPCAARTLSSATCDEMCHMRLSLRNFMPYGPSSSDSERISAREHKDSCRQSGRGGGGRRTHGRQYLRCQSIPRH